MKRKLRSLIVLFFGLCTIINAQPIRIHRCGSDEYLKQMKAEDPGLEARMIAIEKQTQQWIAAHPDAANQRINTAPIIIPVIVHVVYANATQNISDVQVKSQIDVLNEDYGGYSSDNTKVPPFFRAVDAHDMGIRFVLAARDPSGNPSNGIRRVATSVASFSTNNNVKHTATGGDDAWPNTSYMNLWVCNLGGGLLGYGQFPGGAAATDGAVILYSSFGRISQLPPYNYGGTAAHEFSHCFNLFHIWGDDGSACTGSDQVTDTPNQAGANTGTLTCHTFTCNNQPTGDMWMNIMDYTDDKSYYMFTAGQKARVLADLNGPRFSLQSSLGATPPSLPAVDAGITFVVSPGRVPCLNTTVSFIPVVVLKNFASNALTSCTINYKIDAGTTQTFAWTGNLASAATDTVSLASMTSTPNDHLFYAWTSAPNGIAGADSNAVNDRTSRNFVGHAANVPFPLNQGFDVSFPPASWANKNYDCGTAWAKTSTAFHTGTSSVYFNNFAGTATLNGVMDEFYTQPIDMSTAPANSVLSFYVAYAQKALTATDTLEVFATTDCGETFTSIYKQWGTSLSTAPVTTSAFVPTSAQWRKETISLVPYLGVKNLILAFRNTYHGGNNVYIDDFSVSQATGINSISNLNTFNIFPNPSNGIINVSATFTSNDNFKISIANMLGQQIYFNEINNSNSINVPIDLSTNASGIYMVSINSSTGTINRKIILNK